jgi:hypothetical protein
MRGNVYRLGRRRTGSILLAMAVAAAFAGGASATAMAKPAGSAHQPAKTARPAGGVHTTLKAPSVRAHATGHKIA